MSSPMNHGSVSTYTNKRCRCGDCREAWSEYQSKYKKRPERREWRAKYLQKRYTERRTQAIDLLGGRCVSCGSVDALEFDHVDPENKSYWMNKMFCHASDESIAAELDKCQLLCSSCHSAKTNRQRAKT